ncbi:MAG: hypothetical protein ACRDPK_16810 [Carbonactinosporaceae bacterium]
MSCERLLCASCAGPVSEGRCGVCRAGRARIHNGAAALSPVVAVVATILLIAFVLVVERLG